MLRILQLQQSLVDNFHSLTNTGWNFIQYLIGAEIFSLRVRSLGTSMIICFHFVNQYGNSKVVSLMLLTGSGGLGPKGTFWFFAAVTLLGLGFVYLFLPETAGRVWRVWMSCLVCRGLLSEGRERRWLLEREVLLRLLWWVIVRKLLRWRGRKKLRMQGTGGSEACK